MSDTPKCAPDCYTKGKGCTLSTNGVCLHLFKNGDVSQYKHSNKTYYVKPREYLAGNDKK